MNKSLCLFLFFLLNVAAVKAQNWAGGADDDNLHFTYTVQYNAAEYKVFKQADWQAHFEDENGQVTTGLDGIRSRVSHGFGIGLGLVKNITDRTEIRLIPTFVLNDRILIYDYKLPANPNGFVMDSYEKEKTVQGAFAELPFSVKFKSDRRKNFGAYLLGGAKYSINLTSSGKGKDADKIAMEKLLRNTRSYVSYEAGFGFDLFFEYFKLSPEIKYSSTLNSVLKQDNNAFSKPLDQLKLRQVTFSLYIQ